MGSWEEKSGWARDWAHLVEVSNEGIWTGSWTLRRLSTHPASHLEGGEQALPLGDSTGVRGTSQGQWP